MTGTHGKKHLGDGQACWNLLMGQRTIVDCLIVNATKNVIGDFEK